VSKKTVTVRWLERLFLASGIILLGIYGSAVLAGKLSSRAALADFELAQAAVHRPSTSSVSKRAAPGTDFTGWDSKRVQAYLKSLTVSKKPAIGILRIHRLGIEVPVFEGTDSLTLNRGVGHISGTAAPGGGGNSGIAGHRDGFFRGLKDVALGDTVELVSAAGTVRYQVRETRIVPPSDTSVLSDRGAPTLTLVTCFPFYLLGNAKERFIVWATQTDTLGPAGSGSAESQQLTSNKKQGEE
jgi:sortase A